MHAKQLPVPSSYEGKINRQVQKRIQTYRRLVAAISLLWLLAIVVAALLAAHLVINRSVAVHLMEWPWPLLVLQTLERWNPLDITLGYLWVCAVLVPLSFPLLCITDWVLRCRCGLSRRGFINWLTGWLGDLFEKLLSRWLVLQSWYLLLVVQPQTWWVWGVLALLVRDVSFSYVKPLIFYPLRYTCTAITSPTLLQMLEELTARSASRPLRFLQIARKTRRLAPSALLLPNGHAAGLGNTRSIILTDGLLRLYPPAEIRCVLAHEIGHHVHRDRERKLALGACLTCGALFLCNLLFHWALALLRESVQHPRLLSWLELLCILALGAFTFDGVALLQRLYSRRREYQADEFALRLTGDVASFKRATVRTANLCKLPLLNSPLRQAFLTHPGVSQRLAYADMFASRNVHAPILQSTPGDRRDVVG